MDLLTEKQMIINAALESYIESLEKRLETFEWADDKGMDGYKSAIYVTERRLEKTKEILKEMAVE